MDMKTVYWLAFFIFLIAILIFFASRIMLYIEPYWGRFERVDIYDDRVEFEWYSKGWGIGGWIDGKTWGTQIIPYSLNDHIVVDTYDMDKLKKYAWDVEISNCTYEGTIRFRCYYCSGKFIDAGWREYRVRGNCKVKISPHRSYRADTNLWEYYFSGTGVLYLSEENVVNKPCADFKFVRTRGNIPDYFKMDRPFTLKFTIPEKSYLMPPMVKIIKSIEDIFYSLVGG